MSALVGYASSDEDDIETQPERPAKVARVEVREGPAEPKNGKDDQPKLTHDTNRNEQTTPSKTVEQGAKAKQPPPAPTGPAPSAARPPADDGSPPDDAASRARIQELTMPRNPNFDIPPSPSPPPVNSEAAAELAGRTKKFEHFLELQKKGVYFNDRLAGSTALRNPGLAEKLMDFAGIGVEEAHASTLEGDLAVKTDWPDGFAERLMKENERKVKKDKEARKGVEFVSETGKKG